MRRFLVIGFLVGAGDDCVAFHANETLPDHIRVERVALGGQTPTGLAYVMPYILDQHRPDVVILEIATDEHLSRTRGQQRA